MVLGAPVPRAPPWRESLWSKSRSLPPPIAAPAGLLKYLAAGGRCQPKGRLFRGLGPVFWSRVVKRSFRVIWVVPVSTAVGAGWAAILRGPESRGTDEARDAPGAASSGLAKPAGPLPQMLQWDEGKESSLVVGPLSRRRLSCPTGLPAWSCLQVLAER